jgi:glycosyltransferase involved in cell wall biosynthesis
MARPAHLVEQALRSVLAQDLHDIEVLIGDETGAVAPLVSTLDDPRISYRHNPTPLGFSQNHVALLDRARGRYLAVLHDDDRWEPNYLSSLVGALEAQPDIGLACSAVHLDTGDEGGGTWPVPIAPGRCDDLLTVLLTEEWFLLPSNTMWRREVWSGPARQWPELCCGDLQVFLSAADAGWPLFFVDQPLLHYSVHRGQSGAWRGADSGLGVANDVLAFWDRWLEGRAPAQVALTSRQRARWHLRRARALLLAGQTIEARGDVAAAEALGGPDLPDLRRLKLAVSLPNPLVRAGVAVKRLVTDARPGRGHR